MDDYLVIGSLIGLVVFGGLWKLSSNKILYYDADDFPVTPRSFFSFLWLVCLTILVMQFFSAG